MAHKQNGRIVIIGAGVSGLTSARMLNDKYDVTIFERASKPGGLIKCERIEGSLFHTCGGHVFNTKKQDVARWFWQFFNQENDFVKTDRNSVVQLEQKIVPYPIENHVYMLDSELQNRFIDDCLRIATNKSVQPSDFEAFLRGRFGDTLYDLYFKPYNEKVWRCDLRNVSLAWLEGKLPMPTVQEMLFNNFNHVVEKQFVHSSFYYEKNNGSQFLADALAKGLNIRYDTEIQDMTYCDGKWRVNDETFDKVIYCGNIKEMILRIKGVNVNAYSNEVEALPYHGTTAVFCEIDANPYTWIYLPSDKYACHRIICTGNFSKSNNAPALAANRITATIEFTDSISYEDILVNLAKMPYNPSYVTHKYNRYTYPIQTNSTRQMIQSLKQELAKSNFYMTGRFADWEYYNMDVAMAAAMKLCETMK